MGAGLMREVFGFHMCLRDAVNVCTQLSYISYVEIHANEY